MAKTVACVETPFRELPFDHWRRSSLVITTRWIGLSSIRCARIPRGVITGWTVYCDSVFSPTDRPNPPALFAIDKHHPVGCSCRGCIEVSPKFFIYRVDISSNGVGHRVLLADRETLEDAQRFVLELELVPSMHYSVTDASQHTVVWWFGSQRYEG